MKMRLLILPVLLLVATLGNITGRRLPPLDWWQTDIIYQIYPRSFKDINGDGVGDLKGIISKLDYLHDLGVNVIWLSPIFKSPMVDFGYDISDFRDIEPIFGTITDFKNLLSEVKNLGMKLILDFVPNHTSDQHIWFQKSVAKVEPYTDYFIWKDGKVVNGVRQPPNNWLSCFGGPAWTWNEVRQQYYFHAFAKQQPDLNFRNPRVLTELINILKFWLDHGVDGFRFDSVPFLVEDDALLDEPLSGNPDFEPTDHDYLSHNYTMDQPGTYEVIYRIRKLFDSYKYVDGQTRIFITECYSNTVDNLMRYYGNSTVRGAHFPFNFLPITHLNRQSTAVDFQDIIMTWQNNLPANMWGNWVIGNHDQKRAATRFDPELIDGLHMISLLLPGTTITYNGDELGMEDSFTRWDQTVDPQALGVGPKRYTQFTRDGCRSPFQWDGTINAGFTSGLYAWLPVNPNYYRNNLALQKQNNRSHYYVYKSLAMLKKSATIQRGDLEVFTLSEWVLGFVRSFGDHPTYAVVINLGSELEWGDLESKRETLPPEMIVYAASKNSEVGPGEKVRTNKILLRPKQALVLTTLGMKLVLDFVPNHTSNEHPWFIKSVDKIHPYTDYYMYLEGR
ncbi:hypothetical protein M8J75_008198 [Diaphorina citri]|nr:hypothetical protein M8J75_008198 [Diaphorina citri]